MASIVFPRNLSEYSFWFTFNFYQYNVPLGGGMTGVNSTASSSSVVLTSLGTIRLPMPNQMVDHQDVVYAVEDLGLVAGAALAKFQQTGSWKDTAGAAATGAGVQAGVNVLNAVTPGNGGNILLQTQGLAVNPFMSVMFKSPAFKKHAFKWKLSPLNETESVDMNTIINTFRFNQLPSATTAFAGALLAYPNIVQVTVSGSTPPETTGTSLFSYTFKPAVIESFAANFAPNGQAAMFGTTGAPVDVEISLSLLEIEYWLQNDYGVNPTTRGNATANNVSQALNDFFSLSRPAPGDNSSRGATPLYDLNTPGLIPFGGT